MLVESSARVAPFTGAWIETGETGLSQTPQPVAPFTGAWIETWQPTSQTCNPHVAPFTGAWIETIYDRWQDAIDAKSRPSRARGLKLHGLGGRAAHAGRALHGRVD